MDVMIELIEESSKQNSSYSPLDLKCNKIHVINFQKIYFSETSSRIDVLVIISKYIYYLNRGRGKIYSESTKNNRAERYFEYDAAIHTSQIKRDLRSVLAGLLASTLKNNESTMVSNTIHTEHLSYEELRTKLRAVFWQGASIKTSYT